MIYLKMKENEYFIGEEKSNFNESINIPTFSITSTRKYTRRKRRIKKNDEDEFTFFRMNNNINNINPEQEIGHDLQPLTKFLQMKNKELPIFEEKKIVKNKLKFGRKKKDSLETGKHNKYSGDNLFRKCKGIILNSLLVLINKIIAENYKDDPNYDKNTKKLLKINHRQIINSDVQFNKEFINKKIGDIFSDDITLRCRRYNIKHNEILIQNLINEKDETKRILFRKIFNLTFLDCLNHFRGTKIIKELNGLKEYDEVCKSFEEDEDYLYSFKYYIDNYEKIMENKKWRKKKTPQK